MDRLNRFSTSANVYMDTNCFIYFLENHPDYHLTMAAIFEHIIQNNGRITTSELTLAELLVKPYKLERPDIVKSYEDFLNTDDFIDLIEIDQNILKSSAQIKAKFKTPLADAIHIVSYFEAACDTFLTNDMKMKGLDSIPKDHNERIRQHTKRPCGIY